MVCAEDDRELLNLIAILPELEDYPATGAPTASEVAGRHVIGNIPHDLDWLTASVTRAIYRQPQRSPRKWTVEDYRHVPRPEGTLIQHVAERVEGTAQQMSSGKSTFITDLPEEALHWKARGVVDYAREIVVVTTDPDIPVEWSRLGVFDYRTSFMVIEDGIRPERWHKDLPVGATPIYTHLPHGAEAALIHGRHVAGRLPAELLHKADALTTWPCDQSGKSFGQPVTCRYELLHKAR